MAERDYRSQPVADALGLRSVIDGLVSDLQDTRAGLITPPEAMARAALAKQIFAGVRLFLVAHQMASKQIPPEEPADQPVMIQGQGGAAAP